MGKVLLVVDDSRTIRSAVELIFEGTEYRVVAKENGEAGLAWMRTHTPDLILVDERMGDMDGYDFGAQVKSNAKNEDVPILLLACQDGPDESRADGADLDGYVNKPFGSQELVTLVEMLTGSSQISQMPLSFKEQLSHRQRERAAKAARTGDITPVAEVDELGSLEAELASVAKEPPKPKPKKDEPVLEIPVVEKEVELSPVKLELPRTSSSFADNVLPKPEPMKPEPMKPEPMKPEPMKSEPKKPEPIKPEPIKPQPIKESIPPAAFKPLTPPPKPIPHADLQPPPPRFPPAPSADLAIPLPPAQSATRREASPPRRPMPTPPPPPAPVYTPPPPKLKMNPPPPVGPIEPPEEPTPDEAELNIEAPVEAAIDAVDPADAPAEIQLQPPPPLHYNSSISSENAVTVPPQSERSTSRGLLFALLALAVIGGLVAFYFVSQ